MIAPRCDRCPDPATCGGCGPDEDVCDDEVCCQDPWACRRERCPADDALDLALDVDGSVVVVEVAD